MTTTITLQTVGWPAIAIITDHFSPNPNTVTTVVTRQRVERYQTIPFYCTDTRSVSFEELTAEGWQDKPVEDGATPGIVVGYDFGKPQAEADAMFTGTPLVADSDGTDGH